jgi:hypothetical protein
MIGINVIYQRGDDEAKCAANDDCDSQIQYIALANKVTEFF